MSLTPTDWLLGAVAAIMVGFSKTGMPGLGIMIVPLLAAVFPGKVAVGALLPLLIVGDIYAIIYYRRHAVWSQLWSLMPWVAAGMALGFWALVKVPNAKFTPFLGGVVFLLVLVEVGRKPLKLEKVPQYYWFTILLGMLSGFATTVGNVAGPIMSLYLLSRGLDKNKFMGTGAWYYLIINCSKLPLFAMVGRWTTGDDKMMTAATLSFDGLMIPFILVGAFVGVKVFPKFSQAWFDRLILLLSAAAGLMALNMVFAGRGTTSPPTVPLPPPQSAAPLPGAPELPADIPTLPQAAPDLPPPVPAPTP